MTRENDPQADRRKPHMSEQGALRQKERFARRAAALRTNLHRRKAWERNDSHDDVHSDADV